MKLGYDLTIEQTQKLALTPELIQAIQICAGAAADKSCNRDSRREACG